MSANRILDRRFDALNPRTATRELVTGAMERVMHDSGPAALQYGSGQGFPRLREHIRVPGMGETTALLSQAEPDVNYVAVEVYEPGLAQLMLRQGRYDDAITALQKAITLSNQRQVIVSMLALAEGRAARR